MKAAILGTGSWGTAFGRHLAATWDDVILWGIDHDQIRAVAETHTHPACFGDLLLPDNLTATADLPAALAGADAVFFVLPSQVVRPVAQQVAAVGLPPDVPVVSLSKGLELSSLKRLSVVLEEELGADGRPVGVLLGPSHAEEVVRGLPTAVVLAGRGHRWHEWQERLSGPKFRVYTNHDLVGVEFASAFKNVIAIAVGICDGLELGDNVRGTVMTRALKEMARLGVALGGHHETFFGLSGVGDMITTCTSRHSRNRNYGEAVARAHGDAEALLAHASQVVEGAVMTRAALKLCAKHAIELPITQEVHHVLFSGKDPWRAVADLMERDLRAEIE
ncbi:MAG TPA: NAD(P)H-dependent glycerol-3-phosphate dehydrogenase [Candidatus Krumholzibacteria bacterium]|nr:NAD(P)H-dependent glycerol-3-phosphate dehydrogenase [Candidatus Krumholzibacteria bacterium]HRX52060.1 NAD(P)H-dependent glycerol-3-phosphate dehydrogenase [Candidatus Krumholzibacteria bacterium]